MAEEKGPTVADWLAAGAPDNLKVRGMNWDWSCFTGALGLCGCGESTSSAQWLLGLLLTMKGESDTHDARWEERKRILGELPEPVKYLVLYWIDDRGWSEHGSNILFGWLTDEGEQAVELLGHYIRLNEKETR